MIDADHYWPSTRLGEAIEALARRAGLEPQSKGAPRPPATLSAGRLTGQWIEAAATVMGLECESMPISYADFERRLPAIGPAVLEAGGGKFLALLDEHTVLSPDLTPRRIRPSAIRAAVFSARREPLEAEIDSLLQDSGIPPWRLPKARLAILDQRLNAAWTNGCWLLRTPAGAGFSRQLKQARVWRRLTLLTFVHLAQYALWVLAWWLIGKGALEGRLDPGWLIAWALVLVTIAPLRALSTWLQGRIAIAAGGLLKERLLYGALRLEPDESRRQGAGQLLGRVLESQSLENLALSGGFLSLIASVELAFSLFVLAIGAGGVLHAVLLIVWIALAALLGRRYFTATGRWAADRLSMTHDLVERMEGLRTRLVQEAPERWHDGEDQSLEHYLEVSRPMDRRAALLQALIPRGWLVVAILGLSPGFVSGAGPQALAVGIGGSLLAYQAFRRLTAGLWNIVGAAVAWRQVQPLSDAAARPAGYGSPADAVASPPGKPGETLIEASDLVFRYRTGGEPVLKGCSLRVATGDRVLLAGASGGGKSTLASLLTGIRRPESGLLLARGLDRHTLGPAGWLRRIAAAPQFHENHILSGPLVFNLLLGRPGAWTSGDFEEAEQVCRELGLGNLLERMPGGLLQLVGETGWQLSHGERSRVYIARALLQGSDVLLLDESLAALDPNSLQIAIGCITDRAPTVVVIAHP